MKIQSRVAKIFTKIIFNFKSVLFRNRDIISGEELVEYGIVSKDTKNILKSLKKLRKLNNIYYVWDYNKEFKKLIFSYKYNRKKIMAKLIAELIKDEFYYVLKREKIDIVSLYYAQERPYIERDGNMIMIDDHRIVDKLNIQPEDIHRDKIRFRTLGCYPLTGGIKSEANTLDEIVEETLGAVESERTSRVIDHEATGSMERRKREGYF